ncbi:Putative carbonic anhydrase 5 [Toxocara canis]|uniref:carbonic anhydrase n=1 Tax=Toxocara canis TaxID=6265 RepID=A0A0B2VI31_TOXCA|nr:Putative carbonic anhydrase 5 [Toxocara canis]
MLLFFVLIARSDAKANWGYGEKDGPGVWPGTCRVGTRQSPVDISPSDVYFSPLPRLNFFNYDRKGPVVLENTGNTGLRLTLTHLRAADRSGVTNDYDREPLNAAGQSVVGIQIHLVHVKKSFVPGSREPLEDDAIAMVGVFLIISNDSSPLFEIASNFLTITKAGSVSDMIKMEPQYLLPQFREPFYRYEGSLTTPPCDEAVVWMLMAEPVSITYSQLSSLRKLRSSSGKKIASNNRPRSALNGRKIAFRPALFV